MNRERDPEPSSGSRSPLTEAASPQVLLEVTDLRIEFRGKQQTVVAVPRLSFSVRPGESYGLVGESGCGKSTTAMAIMGYLGATGVVAAGRIRFTGRPIGADTDAVLDELGYTAEDISKLKEEEIVR